MTSVTQPQLSEVAKLKQMAIDKYADDHGVMCECFSHDDYVEAINKDGTAEVAWVWHLRIVGAQRETQACYDTGEGQ